jgi:hypothetical protein
MLLGMAILALFAGSFDAHPKANAATPTSGETIRAYLNEVRPLYTKAETVAEQASLNLTKAVTQLIIKGTPNRYALSQASRKLVEAQTWSAKLAKVKAPSLGDAHRSLVQSLRVEIAFWKSIASATGRGNAVMVEVLVKDTSASERLAELAGHWSEEVTAVARSAGIAVPFWVKKVGV